jgi:hypothetical protein
MRVPRAQQAQDILGPRDWVLITERGDEVALLIGQRVMLGFPEVLDRPSPRHGTQRGRSGGWPAGIWLAYIVTAGAPRTVSLATARKGMHHPLRPLSAQRLAPLACRDARVRHRLKPVRPPAYGPARERALPERRMERYHLAQHGIRGDAPTVSGAPAVTAGGLGQLGHSQAAPTPPPITGMRGSLAPWGRPRATEGWSGARAAAGFDSPRLPRLRTGGKTRGLVLVGEGKMRALATRAALGSQAAWSLAPWPLTGATAAAREAGRAAGGAQAQAGALDRLGRVHDRGPEGLTAAGDARERTWWAQDGPAAWSERVWVVRSPRQAHQPAAGLEKRRTAAERPLAAVPPPRGRGKRQSTDAVTLVEAMALVRTAPRVDGGLRVPGAQQVAPQTPDVGSGRGAVSRAKRGIEQTRAHLTHLGRQRATRAALRQRGGWKAWVTQAGPTQRSVPHAVFC